MRPDLISHPLRNLKAACRAIRQAVAIWSWIKAAYANVVAFPSRLRASITGLVTGLFSPIAVPAAKPRRRMKDAVPKPGEKPRWRRWKHLASIFGFHRSKPADRTSLTVPKSSNESSSTSVAPAGLPPCSSSSTTTRRRGAPPATGCSKRSAGSCRKTSTKAASNDRSRSGRKTNSSRSCRPDSNKPCK